uniref:Large ribosomal subunit protein eL6 n=1 Tax=Steinernema glaseri TaxID=37863 RepID=A0A1I8A7R6_9BILA
MVGRFTKSRLAAPRFVVKKIGGDKNGGERKVLINKPARFLPETGVAYKKVHNEAQKVPLRKSITPGTVLIVLAGNHKGKRVVFLKQLEKSGLLLVTGPLKLNRCPMRRIAQSFVIATKTKIDVSKVKIPEHIDDKYFKHSKKQAKKGENIFATGKTEFKLSDQRKEDQKSVDSAILAAIKASSERKALTGYLKTKFGLAKNQYPHNMIF